MSTGHRACSRRRSWIVCIPGTGRHEGSCRSSVSGSKGTQKASTGMGSMGGARLENWDARPRLWSLGTGGSKAGTKSWSILLDWADVRSGSGLHYSSRGYGEPWDIILKAKVHVLSWPSTQLPES